MSSLYGAAADILQGVLERRQGLKTLLYSSDLDPGVYAKVYALVSRTVLHRSTITKLVTGARLSNIARTPRSRYVVLIMVYDLLFGQGRIAGGGALKKAILTRTDLLHRLLDDHKAAVGAATNADLTPARCRLPRYARVNTLLADTAEVLDQLRAQLGADAVVVDDHVPDLLRLPSTVALHSHALVANAHLILQDKASCLPAVVLLDTDRSLRHVIDACSAPGNKTLQLAARLKSDTKLTALERDRHRYQTLQRRINAAGAADFVETRCADFRSCAPGAVEFVDVDAILLDPSCSGSGLAEHRIEALLQNAEMAPADLQRLQTAQIELILHAMRFPNVARITYSTCSVHRAENEGVVEKVLRRQPGWELAPALPSFPGRGIVSESLPNAALCVRSSSALQTHGFFVALFVKKSSPEPADERTNAAVAERAQRHCAETENGARGLRKTIGRKRRLKKSACKENKPRSKAAI